MKFAITLLIYLLNSGFYLWYSPEYKDAYPNEFAAWYFGSEGVFIALLLFFSANSRSQLDRHFIFIASGFIFLRSILYILNYTLILNINARVRMVYLALYVSIIVLPTFISAYRHGHFKS